MLSKFQQRVRDSCSKILKRDKSIGPLDLLVQLGFLPRPHLQRWQMGDPLFEPLEKHIQCGEKKLAQTWAEFAEWVREQKLESFEGDYLRASRSGGEPLRICVDNDAKREAFFKTHYRSANLTDKQKQRIEAKQTKVPDLVVFESVSDSDHCNECGDSISKSDHFVLEKQEMLCLACADMDHLEMLPSGDATLTRRARKHSQLSAVVKRFNRRRKRYDRLGILVSPNAIQAAEAENEGDADQRAKRRAQASQQRAKQDAQLVEAMIDLIVVDFPGCTRKEAYDIASHTAQRGSGRVGRSAAGRDLEPQAVELAVIAWIRHQHTPYDRLLMQGVERQEARNMIRADLNTVLSSWKNPPCA